MAKDLQVKNEQRKLEQKSKWFYRLFPLYTGLSADLLFFIAIDTLFLTVVKGFSAVQISLLGVIPTLVCIVLQKPILKLIRVLGNANASRVGSITLLLSSLLITFGNGFILIAIGQFLYDVAFVLKNMESIVLRDNLEYQGKPEGLFDKKRHTANTVYAVITFIIALGVGPLFNLNPYLPMYGCIAFCIINVILSFSFFEIKKQGEQKEETKDKKIKQKLSMNKMLIWALISNTLFLGLVIIGQQDSKLFIQYQLTDLTGITLTATYIGFMTASSRVSRIVINLLFQKFYQKLKKNISIILSCMLTLAFAFIIVGYLLPITPIAKFIVMAIGFNLIIPLRDPFIVYMEDLLLVNYPDAKHRQNIFTNMELLRKFGKIIINFGISLLLLKCDLFIVMIIFALLAIIEIGISYYLLKKATRLK